MKTTRSFFISVKQFFVYLAVLTLTSCGSFQFSSYYSNDGIYSTEKNITSKGKKMWTIIIMLNILKMQQS